MESRLHYSRPLLLQLQESAVSPAPAPAGAATGAITPEAQSVPAADAASTFLNDNTILILAVLSAALALRVAEGALRVTRRGCHTTGADDDAATQDDDPEHGGGGGEGQGQEARHGGKLVQALPCLAYSAGLELAGSSRSECAICLAAFARGEAVRVLPRCGHGFHARCIDRWLAARPTCPTCRQEPFAETTAPLQPTDSFGPAAIVPLVRVAIVGV